MSRNEITITRGNAWDYVKCTGFGRIKLRDLLSVPHPSAKHMPSYRSKRWDGIVRYFNGKRYPSGLYEYITLEHTVVDLREALLPVGDIAQPAGMTLRDYQEKAVLKGLLRGRGIVDIATNGGKTIVFGSMIKTLLENGFEKRYGRPIFVLIHRKEIFEQIVGVLRDRYGISPGFVQASRCDIQPVTVCMVTSLFNAMNADRTAFDFVKSAGAVFVDECHHASSKTYQSILSVCEARYRFGFSGSVPEKGSYAGMEVRKFLGPRYIRVANSELIQLGLSAKPKVYVTQIVNDKSSLSSLEKKVRAEIAYDAKKVGSKVEAEKKVGASIFHAIYNAAIVNNKYRNNKIKSIVKKSKGSILVVVDSIEHGEILTDKIQGAAFVSGQTQANLRAKLFSDFSKGKQKILVATNIVDEGIDIDKINVVIFAGGRKSRRQYIQRIGRGLRKKEGENVVLIYDFYDLGHRIIQKHSEKRIALYKRENFEVKEL